MTKVRTMDDRYGQESILVATQLLLTAKWAGIILGISTKTAHKTPRERELCCVQVSPYASRHLGYLAGQGMFSGPLSGLRESKTRRCRHE
jgi:hypothetical protein